MPQRSGREISRRLIRLFMRERNKERKPYLGGPSPAKQDPPIGRPLCSLN